MINGSPGDVEMIFSHGLVGSRLTSSVRKNRRVRFEVPYASIECGMCAADAKQGRNTGQERDASPGGSYQGL